MNRKHFGHIVAAVLAGTPRPAQPMDAVELDALRARCAGAETLELGQILHEVRDAAGQQVVVDEINRRLGQR